VVQGEISYFETQSALSLEWTSFLKNNLMLTSNNRLMLIVSTVAMLLMVPLVAMQFTDEVNWSPFDFIVAAVLLLGTGFLCELVLRKVKTTIARIALCGVLLLLLFVIWAELAVGVFGTRFAGS